MTKPGHQSQLFQLPGGGGHRTGKHGGGWRELEDAARRYYPHAKVTGRWAAQDCMSLDGAVLDGPANGDKAM